MLPQEDKGFLPPVEQPPKPPQEEKNQIQNHQQLIQTYH